MICYKDRSFCSAPCKTFTCSRQFTDEIHLAAREWWGSDEAPIALSDFSKTCPDFERIE